MKTTVLLRRISIALIALVMTNNALAQTPEPTHHTQVIAHRGYWTAMRPQAQNSRQSLLMALAQHFYGSEIDVWLSADDTLMVNHDAELGGIVIEKSTTADCRKAYLHNGETMPMLEEMLKLMQTTASPTQLIIEIKTHSDPARGRLAAQKTVEMVKQMGLQSRVEYIAFSFDICKELHKCDATAKVAYLNGDMTPQQVDSAGLTGLDYDIDVYRQHPEWIAEAHALGLTVNVWTVDRDNDISQMAQLGVDYITTNQPRQASQVIAQTK